MIRLQSILVCVLAIGLHWADAVHAAPANQDSGLERATRTFRLQVYETFRIDRAAYDQRIGQVEQVLRDWRARGAAERRIAIDRLAGRGNTSVTTGLGARTARVSTTRRRASTAPAAGRTASACRTPTVGRIASTACRIVSAAAGRRT